MQPKVKLLIAYTLALSFNMNVNGQVKMGKNPISLSSNAFPELESTNRGLLPRLVNLLYLENKITGGEGRVMLTPATT